MPENDTPKLAILPQLRLFELSFGGLDPFRYVKINFRITIEVENHRPSVLS